MCRLKAQSYEFTQYICIITTKLTSNFLQNYQQSNNKSGSTAQKFSTTKKQTTVKSLLIHCNEFSLKSFLSLAYRINAHHAQQQHKH